MTTSGRVRGTNHESWRALDMALRAGCRGLPGGWTLKRLLIKYRGKSAQWQGMPLTIKLILEWIDAYQERTGKWPMKSMRPIEGASGETWATVDSALRQGSRGLPGGSSLPQLLAKHRGVWKYGATRLTVQQVLAWADAHYKRAGKWPTVGGGKVRGTTDETWLAIDQALRRGSRGLPEGLSLSQLLAERRGVVRGQSVR